MKTENRPTTSYLGPVGLSLLLVAVVTGLLAAGPADAASVALTVKGSDGTTITGYRWIVEEDLTKVARPGIPDPPGAALALSLHTSYAARPIATGCQTCLANGSQPAPAASSLASVNLDPAKHYFVTVLPNAGYSISGAPIEVNRLNPAGAFPSTVTRLQQAAAADRADLRLRLRGQLPDQQRAGRPRGTRAPGLHGPDPSTPAAPTASPAVRSRWTSTATRSAPSTCPTPRATSSPTPTARRS